MGPKSWRFQLHSCSPTKDFPSVHGGNPLMGCRNVWKWKGSAKKISNSHEAEILPASSSSLHPLNDLGYCLTTATGSFVIMVIEWSTYMGISLITASLNNWDCSPMMVISQILHIIVKIIYRLYSYIVTKTSENILKVPQWIKVI